MEMIGREFDQSRPGRAEALTALAALLALRVLRRGPAAPTALRHQALRDALAHRFRSLIELHFRRHQPLTFFAAAPDVTVDHLGRVCPRPAPNTGLPDNAWSIRRPCTTHHVQNRDSGSFIAGRPA